MNKEQKDKMQAAYEAELKKGTITNLDGALGFKVGYEAAMSVVNEFALAAVMKSDCIHFFNNCRHKTKKGNCRTNCAVYGTNQSVL